MCVCVFKFLTVLITECSMFSFDFIFFLLWPVPDENCVWHPRVTRPCHRYVATTHVPVQRRAGNPHSHSTGE